MQQANVNGQWPPSCRWLSLPAVRKQFVDAAVQLCRQSRKDVTQVRPGLMPVEPRRLHEAHHDGCAVPWRRLGLVVRTVRGRRFPAQALQLLAQARLVLGKCLVEELLS